MIEEYKIFKSADDPALNELFMLHNHDYYEIFIFHEGNSNHIVEGATYELRSGDVILLRPDEMHRVWHKNEARYGRTVIGIKPSFYERMGIADCLEVFKNHKSGEKNKIEGDIFASSGISECLERIRKYSNDYKKLYTPIVDHCFCEFLYLINSVSHLLKSADETNKISHVIAYINEHYREDIRLEKLSELFFLSKEYLCRVFKKSTGYTVENYIKRKRILEVERLFAQGEKLTFACSMAGFSDYSVFYKAYMKIHGVSPKVGLKR